MEINYLGPDKGSLIWNINNINNFNKNNYIKKDEKKKRLLDYYNLDERQSNINITEYYEFLENIIDDLDTYFLQKNINNSNTNEFHNSDIYYYSFYNLDNDDVSDYNYNENFNNDSDNLSDGDSNYLIDDINALEKYMEEYYNDTEFEFEEYYEDDEIY